MSPILGNVIALSAVGLLAAVCARNLRKDAQSGSCGGCAGCRGGACPRCGGARPGLRGTRGRS